MSDNKELVQSYKLTTVRDRIGIYGQRLILRLVEMANKAGYIEGVKLSDSPDLRKVERNLFGEHTFTFPLTDIMGASENYTAVKKSVRALMQEIIEYEEEDGAWTAFAFLSLVRFSNGVATVIIQEPLYMALLDFRKGFRRFELQAALQFKSTYSLRLYQLMSGQENPLTYTLEELKKMLGVGDKYPRPRDFFKKVIDPAKAELDRCSPFSFDYEPIATRTQKTGRAPITQVTFYPIERRPNGQWRDNELMRKYPYENHPNLTKEQQDTLVHKFGFTLKGIRNNHAVFRAAARYLNLTDLLDKLAIRVADKRPKNPTGYVLNSIKIELDEKGIDYTQY